MTELRPDAALRHRVTHAQRPRRWPERWVTVLVLALLSGLGMLVFPLLPVVEHTATYHWSGDRPAALPLSPYRPQRLVLTADCAVNGQVLDTVRAVDEGMQAARGRITVEGGILLMSLRGDNLQAPLPAGCQ
ncbi:MAG: hypothetical protein Q4G46_11320, partial [Propionibacteriaceae bacterium]|nr:hypothetical protein [Propionibacteriaceae bacterium]